MMDELGLDVPLLRALIKNSEGENLRWEANRLLDELIEARRLIYDKLTDPMAPVNPVVLWGAAVEALRRLALSVEPSHYSAETEWHLRRAADWLAAIGPDTDKLPCEVCLKPTDRVCARCDRYLCTHHATLNTATNTHARGQLVCHE